MSWFPCSTADLAKGREETPSSDLRVLTANDVYKPERFAALRTMALEDEHDNSKVVLCGDLLGGSLFASTHKGESVIECLNAVGVDYCVLGNHEFDLGAENTARNMKLSEFPWLGSNVREPTGGLFGAAMDLDVFEVETKKAGCVRVGVFGVCTAATPELSSPGPDVVFEDPMTHSRRCVTELQNSGCELIIALTHLSMAEDKALAEGCPGIRVILGGHDHDPFVAVVGGCLIAKCGQNVDHLGVLDLDMERDDENKLLVEHSFALRTTKGVQPDPKILEIADRWNKLAVSMGGQDLIADNVIVAVVGACSLSTRTQQLRTTETAFACVVADAIAASYEECDGSLQNGGFVRSDTEYKPLSEITAHDIREELPFDKAPVLLQLKGSDLRLGLEQMLRFAPIPSGSFPHCSSEIAVSYDPSLPALSKLLSVHVSGLLLDDERTYCIAISEHYVETPGDGVTAFYCPLDDSPSSTSARRFEEHGKYIREVVVDFLHDRDDAAPLDGTPPGRLVQAQS